MPDWKNSDDYLFTNDLSGAGWAWEFLRRNSDYCEDYSNAIKLDQQWVKAGVKRGNPHSIYTPPKLKDESLGQWQRRIILNHSDKPTEYRPARHYGKKWYITGMIQDPQENQHPQFEPPRYPQLLNLSEVEEHFDWADEEESIQIQSSQVLILCLDLDENIKPQLDAVRGIFKVEKKRRITRATKEGSKLGSTRLQLLLRLIDSGATGASTQDFCRLAHPLFLRDYDPTAASKDVYELRRLADQLCNQRGYKTLLKWQP